MTMLVLRGTRNGHLIGCRELPLRELIDRNDFQQAGLSSGSKCYGLSQTFQRELHDVGRAELKTGTADFL